MDLDTLKEQAMEYFEADRIDNLFDLLKKYLIDEGEVSNDLSMLINRNSSLTRSGHNGILDDRYFETSKNKLRKSILDFVKQLKGDYIVSSPNELKVKEIKTKILVFTTSKFEADLREYFDKLHFTNVTICLYTDVNVEIEEFILLVFDNRDLPSNRNLTDEQKQTIKIRTDFMEKCLGKNPYGIHFGNYLEWLDFNREYANAANSSFTLFARIKEMLEFLEALE